MGLADKLKGLTKKAEESVVENRDQIQQAVGKAGAAVDDRTGGKYHEQIKKAEVKTGEMIDKLEPAEAAPAAESPQADSTTKP